MKPNDFRSLHPQAQENIRRKAVEAVRLGCTQMEVARVFGVTRQSVGDWMKRHRARGSKGLKAKQRGRPTGGSLKPWQAAQVVRTIEDRCPEQLKFPFSLWTREAVGLLIERRFGIRLSIWTVGRYLARWGFTPQKPIRRAFEQNSQAVQRWLREQYPAIVKQAKREHAEIYWGDEMGLRSDHTVGRSFSRRGHTPVICGTGQRFGCNMISVITNRGRLNFMVFKKRFRQAVFIEFLNRLVRQVKSPIFLIVDGHPVHKAGAVKRWTKKHTKHFHIFYLPGYSPELNPDEMLNQDVKSNAVGRRRAHTQQELVGTVRSYLWSRQHQPTIVQKYFHNEHVRYAAL